jgi:hypothetical protein
MSGRVSLQSTVRVPATTHATSIAVVILNAPTSWLAAFHVLKLNVFMWLNVGQVSDAFKV